MSRFAPQRVLVFVLLMGSCVGCTSDGRTPDQSETGEEDGELAVQMAQIQRWTHKAALALQARNPTLADFYLHELAESVETVQREVPTYEGYEIADQTNRILVPSVEALDRALDAEEWSTVDRRLSELAEACNQCHEATDHGFVRIDLEDVPNPYPQDFSPDAK